MLGVLLGIPQAADGHLRWLILANALQGTLRLPPVTPLAVVDDMDALHLPDGLRTTRGWVPLHHALNHGDLPPRIAHQALLFLLQVATHRLVVHQVVERETETSTTAQCLDSTFHGSMGPRGA